jgi:hypothetical protein
MSPPRNQQQQQLMFQNMQHQMFPQQNGLISRNNLQHQPMVPQQLQQQIPPFPPQTDSSLMSDSDGYKSAPFFQHSSSTDDSLHIDTTQITDFKINDGRFDMESEETRILVQQMLS